MRKLFLFLLLSLPALAQQGSPILVRGFGAPLGPCAQLWQYEDAGTNPVDFYLCPNGSWAKSSSSAGAGTVTSVALTVNGGASSGALAITGSPVSTSGTFNLAFTGTSGDVMTFGASNAPTDSGILLSGLAPLASPTLTGATLAGSTTFSGITGLVQCLHVNSGGLLSGTGADCGAGGGSGVSSVSGTANQLTVVNGSTTPTISLASNIIPPGTLDTVTVYASSQAGADWVAKVIACLAALPTNGVCDARGLNGTQTSASGTTVAIGADQTLLLGVGTYNSSANPVFTFNSNSTLRGLSKTSTLISATTSGATIASIVGGTAHNNVTVEHLTFSNSNSNGIGFDITGMQRSFISDIRFQQIATGINCNSQTVNTLYNDFYHVIVSPAAGGVGVSLRGICNANQFYSLTTLGGATHLLIGNTGDAINPNQDGFHSFDSESATTTGVDIERGGPDIVIDGASRFEADAIGVSTSAACTNLYGIVVRDAYFSSSNTTNVSNTCGAVSIYGNGQAPNVSYTDGLALGNPVNRAPSVQNFTGTNTLLGWQSFNSATFPSGTSITQVISPLVTGTLHANAAEVGDGASAVSGMMTSAKVGVDANFPLTFSFWASADTNATTFRPVMLLYGSNGALLTTGTGTNVTYSAAGGPGTGSLGYNKAGYICNCFATGGDSTVTTANTYQRYTITVRLPATAFQAQFGIATNTVHHLFVDEFSVTPGPSPVQSFLGGVLALNLEGNIPVTNLNGGSGASTTTFLRGDMTWQTPAGSGTVTTSGSPASGNLATFSGGTVVTNGDLSGDVATSGTLTTALSAPLRTRTCQPGLGDGSNAIAAATYVIVSCRNEFGATWTITSIKCFTDNNGTSTMNVTNNSSTALLTGSVTCTNSFAAGTQSGTTTLTSGQWANFSFVADGTTKSATFVITGTLP